MYKSIYLSIAALIMLGCMKSGLKDIYFDKYHTVARQIEILIYKNLKFCV